VPYVSPEDAEQGCDEAGGVPRKKELIELTLRNGNVIRLRKAEVPTFEELRASRDWQAACAAVGVRPQDLLDQARRQAAYRGRKS
jgi:hypothetical protein